MAKGRKYARCTKTDGIWYRHRGLERSVADMQRTAATSTGAMLAGPFMEDNEFIPQPPPPPFNVKKDVNYKKSNRFSNHDNRNAFQDHGVYLGNGRETRLLGRRLVNIDHRLHETNNSFLSHQTMHPIQVDQNSLYTASFLGKPTNEPPVHRRFPKAYKEPQEGKIKLETSTPCWFKAPEVPYRTPLHDLAVTQEPFLEHNPWRYSNNALKRVYPPYERKSEPFVNNTFNRFGAAFKDPRPPSHRRSQI
ncbi:uncharacterized protein [Haliotis asinina]|uniref:uncharacterized protein isoform X1 n=1 Tax=Haliotis asinina TaxID=109174 RepID=UPI0035322D03